MTGIGDVILTARRAAGVTQEELSNRLGITQAALSRYENNLREPDDDMVARLSSALDLSTSLLSHAFRLQGAIAADVHMRRQRSAKVSDWKAAEARLNLYRMRSAFALERVAIHPQNRIETFDPDSTVPRDAARMLRAQWRMPIGPVRNLVRWLESAGVFVIESDFGTTRIDGVSQWASAHPIILLNARLAADRKRFTLAHELGHLVLHNDFYADDLEEQANLFAAEFLMPEHVIGPDLRKLTPNRLLALKREWGVSMQAIVEHAFRMGRVDVAERQRFYRTVNSRGWKTTEPGSDQIAPEVPALVHEIGRSLLETGLSRDEAAKLFGHTSAANETVFLPPERRLHAV